MQVLDSAPTETVEGVDCCDRANRCGYLYIQPATRQSSSQTVRGPVFDMAFKVRDEILLRRPSAIFLKKTVTVFVAELSPQDVDVFPTVHFALTGAISCCVILPQTYLNYHTTIKIH